jgi:hypothetical protein
VITTNGCAHSEGNGEYKMTEADRRKQKADKAKRQRTNAQSDGDKGKGAGKEGGRQQEPVSVQL